MQEEPWKGILWPQRTRKINESDHRYPHALHTTIIADRSQYVRTLLMLGVVSQIPGSL